MSSLEEQVSHLPQGPGVYRFDDNAGEALYIGKAINLRRRVRQHLDRPMRDGLLRGAVSVEAFETEDENSALTLERQLIYRHRPRRNIRLPGRPLMLCVTNDRFPRLVLTREVPDKDWTTFGPYESATLARRLLETLEATFQIRSCHGAEPGRPQIPCLDFYMGRCSAPCDNRVSEAEYQIQIDGVLSVLRGDQEQLRERLEESMSKASEEQEYERAALMRDRLKAVETLTGKKYLVGGGSYDVIALARDRQQVCIEMRRIRASQLTDINRLRLEASLQLSDGEIIRQFVLDHVGELATHVIVDSEVPETEEINQWRRRPISFETPKQGNKREQLNRASDSALRALKRPGAEPEGNPLDALEELQQLLNLDGLPLTVECVDISNIGARQTTGAIVHMTAGKLFENRAIKLKERQKPNDVAAIGELLDRRLTMTDWHERPDLLIVDGGKGQLNRAVKSMGEWIEAGMAIASLAKREELLFLPGRSEPVRPEGRALRLLQKLRDQTHNTAISAHRRRRDRDTMSSPLDGIEGIGPKRRKQLIDHFGSLDKVIGANVEELEEVVPASVAARIKENFR